MQITLNSIICALDIGKKFAKQPLTKDFQQYQNHNKGPHDSRGLTCDHKRTNKIKHLFQYIDVKK
jgi:hypothetical protein